MATARTRSSSRNSSRARAKPPASTSPRTGRPAIGTRSSVPARRSIRTAISSSRRIRWSISARRTKTSSRPDRPRSTRDRQALRPELPGGFDPRFRQCPEGAFRQPRHPQAQGGGRPSMGALQTYEWAVAYPEMVDRIVPVIGAAGGDAYLGAWVEVWGAPIRLDPKWKGGAYDPQDPPKEGLAAALKVVTLHAQGPEWAAKNFGRSPAEEGKNPAAALQNRFKLEAALDAASAARAGVADANHMLYLVRANQLAAADPTKIKAPALIVYTPTDQVFRRNGSS